MTTSPFTILTDRTRTVSYQRCHRFRWWATGFGERGIVPNQKNIYLVVGIYVHELLATFLGYAKEHDDVLPRGQVQDLIASAKKKYFDLVRSVGLKLDDDEDAYYIAMEQGALIEGLVWAYWHRQLPNLLKEYRVLEVEQEDLYPLMQVQWVGDDLVRTGHNIGQLVWQARADGLLVSRRDETKLYALSFKTAGRWDKRKEDAGNHDMQGISECVALEHRLGRKIAGVKMEFLRKGERKSTKKGAPKIQYSPLIRGYVKEMKGTKNDADQIVGMSMSDLDDLATVTEGQEYYWRWQWDDPENPDKVKRLNYRTAKPYLPWEKGNMGVEAWVDLLAQRRVLPTHMDFFDEAYILPMPYHRHQSEIESWKVSIAEQERVVARDEALVNAMYSDGVDTKLIEIELDARFPKYTHACDYPSPCEYMDLCHGAIKSSEVTPIEDGEFAWRRPHHDAELAALEQEMTR